jgi:hypothetical protein
MFYFCDASTDVEIFSTFPFSWRNILISLSINSNPYPAEVFFEPVITGVRRKTFLRRQGRKSSPACLPVKTPN